METIYTIEKDIQCSCAVVHVKGYLTSAEFRSANEDILSFIAQHGLSRILLEIHALSIINSTDRRWYIEEFIPRIIKAGLRYAAIIAPRNLLARLVVEELAERITPEGITIGFHSNVHNAKSWLATV